jgi:hypothetical protein
MLRPAKAFDSCAPGASGGVGGRLKDVYFDDRKWIVHGLVVETDSWLKNEVVLRPLAKHEISRLEAGDFASCRTQELLHSRCGTPALTSLGGGASLRFRVEHGEVPGLSPGDPSVRRMQSVIGHALEAVDGAAGSIADFILEDVGWSIQYLVVQTRSEAGKKQILVPPEWIGGIGSLQRCVFADIDRAGIERAPGYHPAQLEYAGYLAQVSAYYDSCVGRYSGHGGFL